MRIYSAFFTTHQVIFRFLAHCSLKSLIPIIVSIVQAPFRSAQIGNVAFSNVIKQWSDYLPVIPSLVRTEFRTPTCTRAADLVSYTPP